MSVITLNWSLTPGRIDVDPQDPGPRAVCAGRRSNSRCPASSSRIPARRDLKFAPAAARRTAVGSRATMLAAGRLECGNDLVAGREFLRRRPSRTCAKNSCSVRPEADRGLHLGEFAPRSASPRQCRAHESAPASAASWCGSAHRSRKAPRRPAFAPSPTLPRACGKYSLCMKLVQAPVRRLDHGRDLAAIGCREPRRDRPAGTPPATSRSDARTRSSRAASPKCTRSCGRMRSHDHARQHHAGFRRPRACAAMASSVQRA